MRQDVLEFSTNVASIVHSGARQDPLTALSI